MGSVKEFELVVEFYNASKETPYRVLGIKQRVNVPTELEETVWEELEISILEKMLILMKEGQGPLDWNKFIDGSYVGTEG